MENRGHEYMTEHDREGYPYLLKHHRAAPPKQFQTIFFAYSNHSEKERVRFETQYWLTATIFNPRGTRVKVRVEGNTVHIEGKGLVSGVIRLNDQLVDLDQEVVVMLNEQEVYRGRVERSIRFLLEEYGRSRDPKRLFWNRLEFPASSAESVGNLWLWKLTHRMKQRDFEDFQAPEPVRLSCYEINLAVHPLYCAA